MGELIVLPRAERLSPPMSSPRSTAEILFFTGVRYYRMTEDLPPPPARTPRRRRTALPKIAAKA